jgi:hypothetical protein
MGFKVYAIKKITHFFSHHDTKGLKVVVLRNGLNFNLAHNETKS